MKTGKLILFNILAYITAIFVLYLYFARGIISFNLSLDYLSILFLPLFTITLIFISTFMVNYSFIATYAKSKKNLLRIPLVILSILTFISIIKRITEFVNGQFIVPSIITTILYIVLVLLNLFMLKDLHQLIKKLFYREVSKENF